MIEKTLKTPEHAQRYLKAMSEVSNASGSYGMIGGQTVDLESENRTVPRDVVDFIHAHKTGAMITASLTAGALIGGAEGLDLERIRNYGKNIGLAFQIIDDILDVTGDQEKLGKDIGSDQENQKSTYPSLLGVNESRRIANELLEESKRVLEPYGDRAAFLVALSDFLANREF